MATVTEYVLVARKEEVIDTAVPYGLALNGPDYIVHQGDIFAKQLLRESSRLDGPNGVVLEMKLLDVRDMERIPLDATDVALS